MAIQNGLDSNILIILATFAMGIFMISSLMGCQWSSAKPNFAGSGKENVVENSIPGAHKKLLDHLESPPLVRTEFTASAAMRRIQDLNTELQDLSQALMITNASIATFAVTASSINNTDLATIIALVAQVCHVFIIISHPTEKSQGAETALQRRAHSLLKIIPLHRILVCSTMQGKQALVRQLSPVLHIESDAAIARLLTKHIRSVVVVSEEQAEQAEKEWVALHGGMGPSDAVYKAREGYVLMDSFLSLLVLDLRESAKPLPLAV